MDMDERGGQIAAGLALITGAVREIVQEARAAEPTGDEASADQRVFLTWRDRHCRYPGCDRPITYGLNAHHRIPYAQGGATVVRNMVLYCSQHHTVIHHGR